METIVELTRAIAHYLGEPWTFDEAPTRQMGADRAAITGLAAQAIYLHLEIGRSAPQPGRLVVTGDYPQHRHVSLLRDSEKPTITVAVARGAQTIAGDIQRRFLPAYQAAYDLARQRQQQHETKETELWQLLTQAAAALGVHAPRGPFDRITRATMYAHGHGSVEASPGYVPGTITITANSVPLPQALQILAILRAGHEEAGKLPEMEEPHDDG